MPSHYESFWNAHSFAVVGHSARANFPIVTYRGLKKSGRTVYAVDSESGTIDGDRAYRDLAALPSQVEAVVIEVPRDETLGWVERAAQAGITDVWIHKNRDTPEAIAFATQHGLRLRTGTCAAMYATPGFSYHCIHGWIRRLRGVY